MRETLLVVGAGPRAISLLEWFERTLPRDEQPLGRIVLVDALGAPGRVWRTDQDGCLLMNTLADQSSVFADETVGASAPYGPTLYEWAALHREEADLPDWVAAECAQLQPHSYATRRLFGAYLTWALADLTARLADRCEVVTVTDQVVALEPDAEGRVLVRLAEGGDTLVDRVVLAIGHTAVHSNPEQRALAAAGIVYGPPSHPTEAPVRDIEPGATTLLRGMALNFFDVLAMLTVGRGGTFSGDQTRLTYHPSGLEPQLWVGSRRGIAQYSRIDKAPCPPPARVLTDAVVADLLARGPELDAARDLYPLLVREALSAYYARLGELGDPDAPWAQLAEQVAATACDTPEWDRLLAQVPPAQRLVSLRQVAEPLGATEFPGPEMLRAWMLDFLDADVERALDPERHARAVIPVILRDARWRLQPLFSEGGLSGASYARDVDGWFGDLLRTISNGPPPLRTAQLAALARAGVVSFLGAGTRVEVGEHVVATSSSLPTVRLRLDAVVDCWVPRQDIRRSCDPLLSRLVGQGLLQPAVRADAADGSGTELGAVDIDTSTGAVRVDGVALPWLYAAGIPTEGLRWNTALAGRPGVRSEFFVEMGAIAASVLAGVRRVGGSPRDGGSPGGGRVDRAQVGALGAGTVD